MAPERICSEYGLVPSCKRTLAGRGAKAITCSQPCRQHRARRRRRANDDPDALAVESAVSKIVHREAPDILTRVMKQELAPVVRAAIDEDVVKAIGAMVALTPAAVAVLEDQMNSDDPVLQQRAAALVIKYTVGHPALVQADAGKNEKLEVNFHLPRPGSEPAQDPVLQEPFAVELQTCDICGEEKPLSEFVAGSERCNKCFIEWREKVLHNLHS